MRTPHSFPNFPKGTLKNPFHGILRDGAYDFEVDISQSSSGLVYCFAISWIGHEPIEVVCDDDPSEWFTTLCLDLDESVAGGHYALGCQLPPGGCVYGYRVYEWQGSNAEMTDYER